MYAAHEGGVPLTGPPRKKRFDACIEKLGHVLEIVIAGLRIGLLAKVIAIAA